MITSANVLHCYDLDVRMRVRKHGRLGSIALCVNKDSVEREALKLFHPFHRLFIVCYDQITREGRHLTNMQHKN